MRVSVIAVGRLKDSAERALADRYFDRFDKLGRGIGLGPIDKVELAESRARNSGARRDEEAVALVGRVPQRAQTVALDATGEQLTSEEFAALIARWRDEGVPYLAFVIGGPDGLGAGVTNGADLSLSLGRMTLPHGLARVVLAEQLYRAATILAGHPYHRG